jgi:cytochrome b561/polyisoprenoid-binding protein YceI
MPLHNTKQSFGSVTRAFHWLTALLILTAIPLGIIANDMAYDSSAALAQKAYLFSLHKTVGIAAFATAALRILWALAQTHPTPLHPDRRAETTLATVIHWLLYISMLAVPLTGWVHHAATSGFAPILWPAGFGLGQDLPLVPKSEWVAEIAGSLHWVFTKLLIASILLHVAGALKHHIIDRDATLRRMVSGANAAPKGQIAARKTHALPLLAALMVYGIGSGLATTLAETETAPAASSQTLAPQTAGNWQVQSGTVGLSVSQLGAKVAGQFDTWQAEITFDETAPVAKMGAVTVTIDTGSLKLGSVSDQAKGPDFLNTAVNSTATFSATIKGTDAGGYIASGTLTLAGATVPLDLPFTLTLTGDTATMQGETSLDRRAFGIGPKYPDEATVGFAVGINVALTAQRKAP